MGRWREYALALADTLDERADRVRYRAGRRARGPARVVPYRGYGTAETLRLSGRVLENPAAAPSSEHDTWRTNLRNMLRRLESDEVPGAVVRARAAGRVAEAVTDREGYFHVALEPAAPLDASRVWHEVELELAAPAPAGAAPRTETGEVLVPPPTARFGVISDVDDTVIFTNVTDKLRMARLVFLEGVRTRLPFEGVSAFYRALQGGAGGGESNPIFYVSSSPWNLYDLLVEMFVYHAVPAGPLLLRDFGLSREGVVAGDSVAHKLSKIRPILDTYPGLPFILIGDSGERDPEIYGEVVRSYPGRVLAVYIRQVAADAERDAALERLAAEVLEAGSQLVLARDSRFAAEHAAEKGWIVPGALDAVERSAERDEGSATASEPVPTAERPPEQAIEG